MRLEYSFRKKREADRKAGGAPGPPHRKDRPVHLFIAEPAYHLVDHRRARARHLLDVIGLLFSDRSVSPLGALLAALFGRLGAEVCQFQTLDKPVSVAIADCNRIKEAKELKSSAGAGGQFRSFEAVIDRHQLSAFAREVLRDAGAQMHRSVRYAEFIMGRAFARPVGYCALPDIAITLAAACKHPLRSSRTARSSQARCIARRCA